MAKPVRVTENLWINLPDGRRLAARLWAPESPGPHPAILEYLPYRKRDGTAPRDATTHPVFAANGYACLRVDLAGSGDSDALFDDEYSERELSDGEDVLNWMAAQDWCDGNVGIIGISWGGFNGLQLAFRRPPQLKAVVSVCSTVDRYADDIHFMGGCLLTDNFNWGGQMTAYTTRPPDPDLRNDWRARWVERIEALPFSAEDWLGHAARDDFWKHGSVCEDWSAIEAPVLAIGGWADAYVNAPDALARNNTAPARALMGAWEHKYPHIAKVNPADFHGEVLRWFDHWLRGEENGARDLPPMRAFIQEFQAPVPEYVSRAGRWVAETAWPSDAISSLALHLNETGLFVTPGTGTRAVRTPQHVGLFGAAYFCPGMRVDRELADDQAGDDALSVCFDTAPLNEPLELLGRPELELGFTVDKPAAFLCARLCDVSPDGVSQRLSYRPFNLAHHAGHDAPQPLEPGRRYEIRFALNMIGHRLQPGHRLRLALSTSYWPVLWPSPEAAEVTLHLDECRLVLPRRISADEVNPQAPDAPRAFSVLAEEVLREASSRTEKRMDPDGTAVLETEDDFGMTRNPDHGLVVGSSVAQRFSVHPDDPLSAYHEARWRFEFARGDWAVSIDSTNIMTSDAEAFHMTREVVAREGDEVVHEKVWRASVPRGAL